MRHSLRPPGVVAAAVLMIVAGSELLLAGLGGAGWLLSLGRVDDCCCFCGAWVIGLGILLGVLLISAGAGALNGSLEEPARIGGFVLGLAGFACVPTLLTMTCCLWNTVIQARLDLDDFKRDRSVFAGVLLLWANTAVLLTAGWLLRRNAGRYLRWQEELRGQSAADGYEPEDEP